MGKRSKSRQGLSLCARRLRCLLYALVVVGPLSCIRPWCIVATACHWERVTTIIVAVFPIAQHAMVGMLYMLRGIRHRVVAPMWTQCKQRRTPKNVPLVYMDIPVAFAMPSDPDDCAVPVLLSRRCRALLSV